jgi:hypothetical protein
VQVCSFNSWRGILGTLIIASIVPTLSASAQATDPSDDEEDFIVDADADDVGADVAPVDVQAELERLRRELQAMSATIEELRDQRPQDTTAPVDEPDDEPSDGAPEKGIREFSLFTRTDSPVEASHSLNEVGHLLARGVFLSSYMQGEYRSQQDSEDAILPDGSLANHDGFGVRRSRIKLTADYQYAGGIIEFDGTTTGGGYDVSIRRAESYLQYRKRPEDRPLIQVAAGVIDTLFGYELNVSSRARAFMERSLIIRSIWPSPADVGARVNGAYKWFRYSVQGLNGQPRFTQDGYPGLAPTRSKDLLIKLGADVDVNESLKVAMHVSSLKGRGFYPGSPATKGGVGWSDTNEDGIIQPTELIPIPARAATPAQTFDRWAVGLDMQIELRSRLGVTQVYGEVILAENMDRALYVSDPVTMGQNQRMFGYYVAVVQELTPYVLAGLRYDVYDPNSDLFDRRAGEQYPLNQKVQTLAPLIGLQLPGRARLIFQYDIIRDFFGRDASGVPTNLKNNVWTTRLQVQL